MNSNQLNISRRVFNTVSRYLPYFVWPTETHYTFGFSLFSLNNGRKRLSLSFAEVGSRSFRTTGKRNPENKAFSQLSVTRENRGAKNKKSALFFALGSNQLNAYAVPFSREIILGLHCHAIKQQFENYSVDNYKKLWCYRRLIKKILLQVLKCLWNEKLSYWKTGLFERPLKVKYPASSWFLLRQTREKPLRATVRFFELTAVQRQGRIN